ncbi:MAG: acyltransferase [Acidimicrobiales bacterium]|jgi:peptidoglycan/LPS O-acetylase OafA/YrhL|nr:acyltransferase [Acidimicrobiales bacterium]
MSSPPTTLTGDPTTPDPEPPTTSEPATPTPARFPHLRALDGLRGLAVVVVVLSHFTPGATPGGFLGVDLFFLLSGFLITSLLVSEWDSNGGIALGRFWIRRARRLFPALLLVLAVVAVHGLVFATPSENHQLGLDGLASLFYVANWRFIASGQSYVMQFIQSDPSPLRHMWSLAIEEQFYVLWPLVALATAAAVRRFGARGRHGHPSVRPALAVVSAVLAVASAGWMVALYRNGADLDRLYYGTDTRVFMILVGAAIGAVTAGRPQVPGPWRIPVIALGSLGVVALLVATFRVETSDEWLYAGGYAVIALVFGAVLLGAGQGGRNPLARVLGVRPLVGMGLISYGVYLWHWPITVWVTAESTGLGEPALFALRSALTLGASLASYHLVEQPIRHRGLDWGGRRRLWVTPVAVAALSLGFLVPVIANPAIPVAPEGPAPSAQLVTTTGSYATSPRCDVAEPDVAPLSPDGTLTVTHIGNSLAGEVRPCLTDILGRRGVEMVTVNPPDFLLCDEAAAIREQATDPETRPDAAILFLFVAYDDRCGDPWHRTVDELVATWTSQGTHVFLVPSVSIPAGGMEELQPGIDLEVEHYGLLALADPQNVTLVDAGRFLRDVDGTYLWRMPCAGPDEAGCREDGTVPVRFVDGLHFCTDADFPARGCVRPEAAAGERRAATAIANTVIDVLGAKAAASAG